MVNVRHLLISIAAVLTAIACNKAELEEINGAVPESGVSDGERMTLTITMDESLSNETKMEMGKKKDGKYPLYWSEGDEIAVFASEVWNGEVKQFKFRAQQTGKTATCVDVSDEMEGGECLPAGWTIRGALYPYKDDLHLEKSSVYGCGLPTEQNGEFMDNLCLYVSSQTSDRNLVFSNNRKYWKFVIPSEWEATKITLRSEDSFAFISGPDYAYNLKAEINKEGKIVSNSWSDTSNTRETSVSLSATDGKTLTGEYVLVTRDRFPKSDTNPISTYNLCLEVEREGEMAMIKIPFGENINSYSSSHILKYDFSDINLTWYSAETVELDLSSWHFSAPAKSLLDGSVSDKTKVYHYLNNRVYDLVPSDPGHVFKLYIPNAIQYVNNVLVLTGLEGADTDPSKAPYIEFPVLPGRALAKVEFTTTGGHQSNSTIEGPGSDGNPLVSEKFANSDKVLTKTWNFIRSGQTTKTGAAYRLQGHFENSLTIKSLKLTYMGRDITRPDAIVTGDADVFATESEDYDGTIANIPANNRVGNVKFRGSFVKHTGDDGEKNFEYGIAYKVADGTEYTCIQADPNSTEAEFTATTTLEYNTPYLYRTYVKVEDKYYYGLERRLLFIGMDFRARNGENCFAVKSGLAKHNGNNKYSINLTRDNLQLSFYYPDSSSEFKYELSLGYPCDFGDPTKNNYNGSINDKYLLFNNPTAPKKTQCFVSIPNVLGYKLNGFTLYMVGVAAANKRILICNNKNIDDATTFIFGSKIGTNVNGETVNTKEEASYTLGKAQADTQYYIIEYDNNWPLTTVAFKYE